MAQTSHYIHQIQKVLGFIVWKMSLLETRCTCVGVCRQTDAHLHPVYVSLGDQESASVLLACLGSQDPLSMFITC